MKKIVSFMLTFYLITLFLLSCSGPTNKNFNKQGFREKKERISSKESEEKLKEILSKNSLVNRPYKAQIGILYFTDDKAHEFALLQWLEDHKAKILYNEKDFGYLDVELSIDNVGKLMETAGNLGLDKDSFFKLEIDWDPEDTRKDNKQEKKSFEPNSPLENTLFSGPVHNAGYGTKLEEFKDFINQNYAFTPQGEDRLVSVFDGGVDLSRIDVFQKRIKDIIIGEEKLWINLKQDEELKLEALGKNISVRLVEDSNKKDEFAVQFKIHPKADWGDPLKDLNQAYKENLPQIIDLKTGLFLKLSEKTPTNKAVAIKIRNTDKNNKKAQVAFVGLPTNSSNHGIANLHMIGGNYQNKYQGVAPLAKFILAETWNKGDYGHKWIPLARNIVQAAKANSDVIDLDIYTPGTHNADDLLSKLLCRIVQKTNAVPVVAAHNYGPLPNSIQSLAQSPCALGIGAAGTPDAEKATFYPNSLTMNPEKLKNENASKLYTTAYSGRGFGKTGFYKPDIISPAYAYTAYGENFTRFGGTSGATPATAGLILLFKEAAQKIYGKTLNFYQIRFLLQAGADKPDELRDGVGFMNILRSWQILSEIEKQKLNFDPFAISIENLPNLQIKNYPEFKHFSFDIKRISFSNQKNNSAPIHLKLKFANDVHFLKMINPMSKDLSEEMDWEVPMGDESEKLAFKINLNKEEWEKLAAGEYVAILEATRKNLEGIPGAADFRIPISITKGFSEKQKIIILEPFYFYEHKDIAIETKPGETVFLTAQTTCLSSSGSEKPSKSYNDEVFISIDPEEKYPHTSYMMSSYNSQTLGMNPVSIVSHSDLLRVSFYRYSSQKNCEGPLSVSVYFSKSAFDLKILSIVPTQVDFELKVQGESMNSADQVIRQDWTLSTKEKNNLIILSKDINMNTLIKIPKYDNFKVRYARLSPYKPEKFQAQIITLNDEGNEENQIEDEYAAYFGGFTSFQALDYFKEEKNIFIKDLKEGSYILFKPLANFNSKAKLDLALELKEEDLNSSAAFTGKTGLNTIPATYRYNLKKEALEKIKEFMLEENYNSIYVQSELYIEKKASSQWEKLINFHPVEVWSEKIKIPLQL